MSDAVQIKIEKGVPVPAKSDGLFRAFEVGDSAFFAGADQPRIHSRAYAWGMRQTPHRKFATRMSVEGGVLGIRVWRIE